MKNKSNVVEYSEIADARITDNRSIVISDCSKGGFTIAQRMDVIEDGHTNRIYLKGAIHVNDIQGLYEIRDILNYCIQVVEDRDDENWDN